VKAALATLPAGLLLLCGCAAQSRPQREPGAAHVGAPIPAADQAVLDWVVPAGANAADRGPIRMPDRITLPATYRLILVDGHLALVRETGPQAFEPAPTSMRIVMGEIARGELAYQPGLLPQELAAEVASNRESSARMDNALDTVMQRSRELSAQALELEAQGRKLAELLAASQERVRALESGQPPAPEKPPAEEPGPRGPRE
jgi:hypothetical protein